MDETKLGILQRPEPSSPKHIKRVNHYIWAYCLMKTTLLLITLRYMTPKLTRLLLHIKALLPLDVNMDVYHLSPMVILVVTFKHH